MLEFFRTHKRFMQIFLALFILPGLALVGIQGFRGFFDHSAIIARVNGHDITRQEYERALHRQLSQMHQMRQMFGKSGNAAEPEPLDTPAVRQALLDSLIQQRIIADETQRKRLTVSDDALRQTILNLPIIASLRKQDGSIDIDRYRQLLAAQGLTPEQFDQRVRFALASEQISDNIASSAFIPKALNERLTALLQKQPELRQQIAQISMQSELNAYLASLRTRAKVKIYQQPATSKSDE